MKPYTFVDYATQAYLAWVGLLILAFHNVRVPHWGLLVAAHLFGLGLVHLLLWAAAKYPQFGLLRLLRAFYPLILFTGFYRESALLNQMFFAGYLDPAFIRLEGRLFGAQPSLVFMHKLPYLAVSEFFYASYFSYYVMIGGLGVALFIRNRDQFRHYLSVISFCFYVCYALYILLPVIGPSIFFEEVPNYRLPGDLIESAAPAPDPAAVQIGPFYQLMRIIYRYFEGPGAAFPSSHVALALCTLYFSNRYLPRLRLPHAALVLSLCAATVYCHYHYVVDVFAGAVTAALLLPVANRLYAEARSGDRSWALCKQARIISNPNMRS